MSPGENSLKCPLAPAPYVISSGRRVTHLNGDHTVRALTVRGPSGDRPDQQRRENETISFSHVESRKSVAYNRKMLIDRRSTGFAVNTRRRAVTLSMTTFRDHAEENVLRRRLPRVFNCNDVCRF